MSLRTWLREKFTTEQGKDLTDAPPSVAVTGIVLGAQYANDIWERVKQSSVTKNVETDVDEMYNEDDRVCAITDGLGEDSCMTDRDGNAFTLTVCRGMQEDKAKAQAMADILKQVEKVMNHPSVDIENRIGPITSKTLLHGVAYYQPVIDWDKREVVGFNAMPTVSDGYYILPVYDQKTGRIVGYVQYKTETNKPVATFNAWQLVRFTWNPLDRQWRSLWKSSRRTWKRLASIEQDMVVARKSRAYLKLIWKFPEHSPDQIRRIIETNEQQNAGKPRSAVSDYYTSGDIDALDPRNTQLSEIDDVEYQQRKLHTGGRKPKGLLAGFGEEVNRAVLDRQEMGYQRAMHAINVAMNSGLRELFDLQLKLWGHDPDDVPYVIQWAKKQILSPEVQAEMHAKQYSMKLAHWKTLSKDAGYDPEHEERMFEEDEAQDQARTADQVQRLKSEVGRINAMKDEQGGRGRPPNPQSPNK
jgi:hypothetical protein